MYKNKSFTQFLLLFVAATLFTACTPSKKTYMRKVYRKMKRSVKGVQVSHLHDTVKVLFPTNLMFGSNSAELNPEVLPKMRRFANALNKYDKTGVLVSGYTDSVGNNEHNDDLSLQRADTAKYTLLHYNVAKERLNTWGMGKRHPIATNTTEAGRAKNRRVEFVILYKE